MPRSSSAALASMLLGRLTSPTQAAVRCERIHADQEALDTLDASDREIVALRHFELLSRIEAAQVLGISEDAGSKRYLRAEATQGDPRGNARWIGGPLEMPDSLLDAWFRSVQAAG